MNRTKVVVGVILVTLIIATFIRSVSREEPHEQVLNQEPVSNDEPLQTGIVRKEQLHETRQSGLLGRCSELQDEPWKEPKWSAMSFNRERRVVMCLVGKAAGTTWMRVLLRLTGKPDAIQLADSDRHAMHRNAGKYIGRMHHSDILTRTQYLMGHYYKVMFVREPMERLISGYRDKMLQAPDYVGMREVIKRMFRPNVSSRSKEFQKNVTFAEFVRYVAWEIGNKPEVEEHWRPQYNICRPCHIRYDHIGYYDTMQDDAEDVLRTVAAGTNITFPIRDFDTKQPNSNEYLQLFENVSTGDVRRMLALYENDYRVFGFDIPDIIRHKLDQDQPRHFK